MYVLHKIMISLVSIGEFLKMDRALLYMPRQGVILEQEVCSTTPIKIKRIFSLGSNSKPPK